MTWATRSAIVSSSGGSRVAASGRPAAMRAECASELTGASELFNSWLITRMAFFHVAASCRASSCGDALDHHAADAARC